MRDFIVVDYQEGAGGEFIARWLSAHFGHQLEFDQQKNPDHMQKWLNSHSLSFHNWDQTFCAHFRQFVRECQQQGIDQIAVPYHLYKFPHHVTVIQEQIPNVRFVRICCDQYVDRVYADFSRKVLDRPITSFSELQFLLQDRDHDAVKHNIRRWRQGELTYRDLWPQSQQDLQTLPSQDVQIDYGDFFCHFDQTAQAYEKLCNELGLVPDLILLSALLERNQKNLLDLENHLSTQCDT